MRAIKIIFGILSICLAAFVGFELFQIGFAPDGAMNLAREVAYATNGAALVVAILVLIAGIILLACNGKRVAGGETIAGIVYVIAALVSVVRASGLVEMYALGGICLLFAVIVLVGHAVSKRRIMRAGMFTREQFTGQIPMVKNDDDASFTGSMKPVKKSKTGKHAK